MPEGRCRRRQRELRRAFLAWTRYVLLLRVLPDVTLPEFNDFLEVRDMLAHNTRSWTEQWKQQGLQEGRQEGLVAALRMQLKSKFGTLPPPIEERLQRAGEDSLLRWSMRILTAHTLEQVFEDAKG